MMFRALYHRSPAFRARVLWVPKVSNLKLQGLLGVVCVWLQVYVKLPNPQPHKMIRRIAWHACGKDALGYVYE